MSLRALSARSVLLVGSILFVGGCERSHASPAAPQDDDEVVRARQTGRALFFGRGGCHACHRLGDEGQQIIGPNLGVGDGHSVPVAQRARREDVQGIEYIVESIVDPDAFVVPGYAKGVMRRYEEPPIALSDDEIVSIAAFVASAGPKKDQPTINRNTLSQARMRIDATRQSRKDPPK